MNKIERSESYLARYFTGEAAGGRSRRQVRGPRFKMRARLEAALSFFLSFRPCVIQSEAKNPGFDDAE
ncbi:MAG: hypothetical protein WA861_02105, partial [Candidatus Binatus sp.]